MLKLYNHNIILPKYLEMVKGNKPAEKICLPRSEDGSAGGGWGGECRAVRAWKPRRTARILGGRNRAEISLSFFEFFSGGARKRKIVRENFCEVAAGALAEAGGGAGQSVFRSKKVRAKDIISPKIETSRFERVAPRGGATATGP